MKIGSHRRRARYGPVLLLSLLMSISARGAESSGAGTFAGDEESTIVHLWVSADVAGKVSGSAGLEDDRVPVEIAGKASFGVRLDTEEPLFQAPRSRDLLVFVDTGSTLPAQRDAFLSALAPHFSARVPGRRIALVAADGNHIEVLLPWAEEEEAIAAGLAELAERPVFGLELQSHLARTAAYQMRSDRGTGSRSFAAVGFSGSGRQVGGPDSRPRNQGGPDSWPKNQIESRAARSAAQAAAAVLLHPGAFGLEREAGSPPLAVALLGGAWDWNQEPLHSLGGLLYAAQQTGGALFPWSAEHEASRVSGLSGRSGTAMLASATGGALLSQLEDGWDRLEAPGQILALDLTLPSPLPESPLAELALGWPGQLAAGAPDRWLVSTASWQAGWRTTIAHLTGAKMPAGGLAVQLGEPERRSRNRVLVPVQLEVPLRDVVLHPAGDCWVGLLEVRVAAEDPWWPAEDLTSTRVEVNRLGPYRDGEVERWEGAVSLVPIRQRLLVSVFDPDGGGLWAREVLFEP